MLSVWVTFWGFVAVLIGIRLTLLATERKPDLLVAATRRIPQTGPNGQIVGVNLSVADLGIGAAKAFVITLRVRLPFRQPLTFRSENDEDPGFHSPRLRVIRPGCRRLNGIIQSLTVWANFHTSLVVL